jgi:hypothetical protein
MMGKTRKISDDFDYYVQLDFTGDKPKITNGFYHRDSDTYIDATKKKDANKCLRL